MSVLGCGGRATPGTNNSRTGSLHVWDVGAPFFHPSSGPFCTSSWPHEGYVAGEGGVRGGEDS